VDTPFLPTFPTPTKPLPSPPMNRVFFAALLFFSTALAGAQTNEIQVRFIGNCGLHFYDGSSDLYVDFPYKSGAFGYMTFDQAEVTKIKENAVFLFTHKHADHFSKKNLELIKEKHKGRIVGSWNPKETEILTTALADFKIEVFRTKHRFSCRHYSYLITWHGQRIFISGDTESAVTIARVPEMDWAFVPYWILSDANKDNLTINAKRIGLYHLYPTQVITGEVPEKITIMNKQDAVVRIAY
jgi:L-ascorbate metabolism protein UlaG (beta-lactamase superfamily)